MNAIEKKPHTIRTRENLEWRDITPTDDKSPPHFVTQILLVGRKPPLQQALPHVYTIGNMYLSYYQRLWNKKKNRKFEK